MAKESAIIVSQVQLSADPSSPASGRSIIYPKTDGCWYFKNSDGVVFRLAFNSYSGGGADYNIADTNYVTVASATMPIAAGDRIGFRLHGLILNNSLSGRTYTFAITVGAFVVAVVDGATVATNASNKAVLDIFGAIDVRASNLAYGVVNSHRSVAVAVDTSDSNTNTQNRQSHSSTSSDLTGSSVTVAIKIKSSANTATQTFSSIFHKIEKG